MASKKKCCPYCKTKLEIMATTDSDQRIYGKWYYCENCGYDQRKSDKQPVLVQPINNGEGV